MPTVIGLMDFIMIFQIVLSVHHKINLLNYITHNQNYFLYRNMKLMNKVSIKYN